MPHSYVQCRLHCIFSTKGRRNLIPADVQPRLWAYIGGIARDNGLTALAVGGTSNHAHALLAIPATITIAKAIQLTKAGSSAWLHETFPTMSGFAWQEGYAAFSVSASRIDETVHYIQHQYEHHRTLSFEDEFKRFLERHAVEYDPRYAFG
jgi:REP element-mobilizing transposase RayT